LYWVTSSALATTGTVWSGGVADPLPPWELVAMTCSGGRAASEQRSDTTSPRACLVGARHRSSAQMVRVRALRGVAHRFVGAHGGLWVNCNGGGW
jgi:hypothetical protein